MGKSNVVVLPDTLKVLQKMGRQIKKARVRRNISAEDIANRVGIARTTLWAVEKGAPEVGIGVYAAVLKELGLDKELEMIAEDREYQSMIQDISSLVRKRATGKRDANM